MLQVLWRLDLRGSAGFAFGLWWQYQHETYIRTLADNGFIQSMSRKGNCIDNGATESRFGTLRMSSSVGRTGRLFESFKVDFDAYHALEYGKASGLYLTQSTGFRP